MLLVILKANNFLERFSKNNFKKQIKKSLELKKYKREKVINCILNGKAPIALLIVELMKKK